MNIQTLNKRKAEKIDKISRFLTDDNCFIDNFELGDVRLVLNKRDGTFKVLSAKLVK